MKRNGQVLDVKPKDQSRHELTVTTEDYGRTRVTLMAGVLGTEDGLEVVDRASHLRNSVFVEVRRSARDERKR